MGLYARTESVIACDDKKKAKAVVAVLKKMKKDDINGNFVFEEVRQEDCDVYLNHYSGRVQNLEWQMEQVWEAIKHLANEISAPFMVEGEGVFHSNED